MKIVLLKVGEWELIYWTSLEETIMYHRQHRHPGSFTHPYCRTKPPKSMLALKAFYDM